MVLVRNSPLALLDDTLCRMATPTLRFYLGRLRYSLRDRGALGTLAMIGNYFRESLSPEEHNFDQTFKVNTTGRISAWRLGVGREGNEYKPIPVHAFRQMLRHVPVAHREWSFIDIGCGKGRAVILACTFPFASVAGVELSDTLCAVARSNAASFAQDPRCVVRDAQIVCADATVWPIPPGKVIIHMNSPFVGAAMQRFAARLADRVPDLYVLYWNPRCAAMFAELGFRVFHRGRNFVIYH